MIPKKQIIALLGAVAVLAGTSSLGHAQSRYCKSEARAYADRTVPGAANALVGGAIGAGAGAALGAAIGGGRGAKTGAIVGGVTGATAGGVASANQWQKAYNAAYNRCMRASRGQKPVYHAAPQPWTPAWYEYCSAKYRSFNPNTGRYTTYSGRKRMCR